MARAAVVVLLASLGLAASFALFNAPQAAHASPLSSKAISVQLFLDGAEYRSLYGHMAIHTDGPVTYSEEWGPTTDYGSDCGCAIPISQAEDSPNFPVQIGLLPDGTTFHWRIAVTDGTTTVYSNDVSGTTRTSGPPIITAVNPPWVQSPWWGDDIVWFTPSADGKGYAIDWSSQYSLDSGNTWLEGPTGSFPAVAQDGLQYGGASEIAVPTPYPPQVYLRLQATTPKGTSNSDTYTIENPGNQSTTTTTTSTTPTTTVTTTPSQTTQTTTTTQSPTTGPQPTPGPGSKVPTTVQLGRTITVAKRTQTGRCTRGALPDRQCSPGAFYSGLTKAVLCSASFQGAIVRNLTGSQKHRVETEYGMAAKSYGRAIEIDRIIPPSIGGSDDIANLFPESRSGRANYHDKDRLDNRLRQLVCSGSMTLHAAQTGIAHNWETLYNKVFGTAPNA